MSQRSAVHRSGVALALIAGMCVGTAGQVAGQSGCSAPYSPLQGGRTYPAEVVVELPGAGVTTTPVRPSGRLDATGAAYVSTGTGTVVQVVLPAGVLDLTLSGATAQAFSAGDLDGDGIAEIGVIGVVDGAISATYVVPSSTAPGSHDVAAVGIRVPNGLPLGDVDWPGLTGTDLVLGVGASPNGLRGSTTVLSGTAVMAAGPGGDATGAAVLASVDGALVAVVAYPERSAIVTIEADPSGGVVRTVDASGTSEFTPLPAPALAEVTESSITVSGSVHSGRRFLRVGQESRSGNMAWMWAVDGPCDQVAAAAAAEPVRPAGQTPTAAPLRFAG